MITSIVKFLGAKIALSYIKNIVKSKKDNIVYWCSRIQIWMDKIEMVLSFLKSLRLRLSDGVLTNDEAKDTLADAKQLAIDIKK